MTQITGIKSVDFKVTAHGYGVVNWNGPTAVLGKDNKEFMNHSMPKLRGYTNRTGTLSEKGYAFKKEPQDIDFSKTPMYVSANCIRHHLFIEHSFDSHFANKDNQEQILASDVGLLRGMVNPATGAMRISPLFITDFIEQDGKGNFEQMGRSGSKEGRNGANSHFSKTTFGDTRYEAYGSINIEQLSFISLDSKFGRPALIGLKESRIEPIVEAISDHIKRISPSRTFTAPLVVFHENYVRQGTIFDEGEAGLMLSQEAIDALVDHMIDKIRHLSIKQGKGYLTVDAVELDYNDSRQMMRIKNKESELSAHKSDNVNYATYFVGV